MRTSHRWIGLVIAATAIAAACKDASGPLQPRDGTGRDADPRLYSSPTTSTQVKCPAKVQLGQTFNCVAWGVDTYGVLASGSVSSWSSSHTSIATVNSSGVGSAVGPGSTTISATIGGVTGTATVAVRDSAALTATVSGPSVMNPNVSCLFWATPAHAAEPVTYSWSASGTGTGTANGEFWTGQATSSFTLSVTITDADGRTGTGSKNITVLGGGGTC